MDSYEVKHHFLIKKSKVADRKYFNDSKVFVEYSNDMDDIYENIEEYYPNGKNKIMIVFDFIIAVSNKKFNPIITKLFSSHNFILLHQKIFN